MGERNLGYGHQQVLLDIAKHGPSTNEEITDRTGFDHVGGYLMQMMHWGYLYCVDMKWSLGPGCSDVWCLRKYDLELKNK